MSHTLSKIWIHAIWPTKERFPFIGAHIEKEVYRLLYEEFKEAECPARIINGMPDHIHCLFLLKQTIALSQLIKQVKGCSSHTINERELTSQKFCWQTGYASYSVSESQLEKVHNYIRFQKKHHNKMTFQQECIGLAALHRLSIK